MNNYYRIIKRLKKDKPYSERFEAYTKKDLEYCLEYLVEVEDYENCAFLRDYIKIRFDHKTNYLL
jgi:protein-arginine kinase activator protein McsA